MRCSKKLRPTLLRLSTLPRWCFCRRIQSPSFPGEIQIQTNTACNAACIMCPYPETSKELPNGRMRDLPALKRSSTNARGRTALWRMEPFLMNEPFTDTRMVEWIAMAKQPVPQAMVTVTTNGSLLTPKVADRLILCGLDAIWFSFNGATRETYEKIMGVSFEKVSATSTTCSQSSRRACVCSPT